MSEIFDPKIIRKCHQAILNDPERKAYNDRKIHIISLWNPSYRFENGNMIAIFPKDAQLLIDEIDKRIETRENKIIDSFGLPPNVFKKTKEAP